METLNQLLMDLTKCRYSPKGVPGRLIRMVTVYRYIEKGKYYIDNIYVDRSNILKDRS